LKYFKKAVWFALVLLLLVCGSSHAQLILGSKLVPKDSCIAFIFIGHSNMTGRCPQRDTVTDPHLWNYILDTLTAENRFQGWNLARARIYSDRTYGADTVDGPGMPFLKQMNQLYPSYYFCIFENGDGHVFATNYLNNQLVNNRAMYSEIMDPIKAVAKGKVHFGGIVIMLGVSEAVDSSLGIATFSTTIKNLVQLIRYDVGVYDLPVFVGQYEAGATGKYSTTRPAVQQVIAQIDSIPYKLSNAVVIPTDGVEMFDDHHYNYNGYVTFTQRIIDSLMAHNWAEPYWMASEKRPDRRPSSGISLNITPNPFNPSVSILFSVPFSSKVSLAVYDIQGCLVKRLLSGIRQKGEYKITWEGRDAAGKNASPGTYIIRLVGGESRSLEKKILLVR